MKTFTLESALRDKDLMFSTSDKRLFIFLYGNLVDGTFKKRVEENGDIDKIFKELCKRLKDFPA